MLEKFTVSIGELKWDKNFPMVNFSSDFHWRNMKQSTRCAKDDSIFQEKNDSCQNSEMYDKQWIDSSNE